MGITGLLPFLKKASKQTHARNFNGYTAAVDGHGWLHKGAFGCAMKLGMGEPTEAYVLYFMKYINTLIENKITPVVVFDGRSLPAKAITNDKRRESRTAARKKAQALMRQGNKKEAWEYFVKSIHITHEMVHDVIQILRQRHIDYVVAPYEADAQLAYLARNGFVDLVVTEDSDLVLFGCPKILFKLKMTGECVLFDNSKVHLCMEVTASKFQFERFRQMCILSGCDYLESLPGIGLTRAKKIINGMDPKTDIRSAIKLIPKSLNLDIVVPKEYLQEFIDAEYSFMYQLVFDPAQRKLVPLTPYDDSSPPINDLAFCGAYDLSDEQNLGLALGSIHSRTLAVMDNYNVDKDRGYSSKERSMWSKHYTKASGPKTAPSKKAVPNELNPTVVVKKLKDRKRPMVPEELASKVEPTDKELLSLYNGKTDGDDGSGKRRSKRVKIMSLMSTDAYELGRRNAASTRGESGEEEDELTENDESESGCMSSPAMNRKRKNNPFLKSPDIGLRAKAKLEGISPLKIENGEAPVQKLTWENEKENPHSVPLCLIEKNHVYDDDKKLIVKSQYFRNSDLSNQQSSDSSPPEFSQVLSNASQLSIYSVDKESFSNPETQILDDLATLESTPTNSQTSTSSVDNYAKKEDIEEEEDSSRMADVEIVTLNDDDENSEKSDDEESSYFGNNAGSRSVQTRKSSASLSSLNFSSINKKASPSSAPSSAKGKGNVKGKCRSQGLKKRAAIKPPLNQKSVYTMFKLQPKAQA